MIAYNDKAAEYVRMSTESQRFSIINQQSAIRDYANLHGLQIIKTYTDGARSGLGIRRRTASQELLADVTGGQAPFDTILVYDISRWGRFQDVDESAHYEFICRSTGKKVIYCVEPFENDGSPLGSIVKGLKRFMAGEYSRELSRKVFEGQARLALRGFHVGGRSAYGLRRMIVAPDGQQRGLLEFGQRKAMQEDKVILVPGPASEIKVIRKIFDWFIREYITYLDIANRLKEQMVPPPSGTPEWSRYVIRHMLSNEKYIGTMIYNQTSARLSTRKR